MIKKPVIEVYGKSDSGKTTLIGKVINELNSEGFRVAAVKKSDKIINVDNKDKDTWKYHEAGAKFVILSSLDNTDFFIYQNLEIKKIVDIISEFDFFDIILIEGSSDLNIPKIKIGNGPVKENTILVYDDNLDKIIDLIKNEIGLKLKKPKINIEVNGKKIVLSEFPAEIITNSIIGMISSLKGVKDINNVKIDVNL